MQGGNRWKSVEMSTKIHFLPRGKAKISKWRRRSCAEVVVDSAERVSVRSVPIALAAFLS